MTQIAGRRGARRVPCSRIPTIRPVKTLAPTARLSRHSAEKCDDNEIHLVRRSGDHDEPRARSGCRCARHPKRGPRRGREHRERHAREGGDKVTFTIVATNNGPDAADFSVSWASDQLQLVSETCDLGISADTPACEYGVIDRGVTLTTTVVAEVISANDKQAVSTACVVEQPGFIDDPDHANNCAAATVKTVGKR